MRVCLKRQPITVSLTSVLSQRERRRNVMRLAGDLALFQRDRGCDVMRLADLLALWEKSPLER
jgi:hypothetical protein